VMVDLLKSTVEFGTLRWRRVNVGGFDGMPMAGKTGTTQNWGDAWTMGFSPYYTTAVWFGFDTPGNSLGRELTGATAAGPTWAQYMKAIHQGLEVREFEKPESGLVTMRVCEVSGLLPTKHCNDTLEELFIAGTEPKQFCDIHPFERERDEDLVRKLQDSFMVEDFEIDSSGSGSSEDFLGDMEFSGDSGAFDSIDPQSDLDLDGISTDDLRDEAEEFGQTDDIRSEENGEESRQEESEGTTTEESGTDSNVNPLLE